MTAAMMVSQFNGFPFPKERTHTNTHTHIYHQARVRTLLALNIQTRERNGGIIKDNNGTITAPATLTIATKQPNIAEATLLCGFQFAHTRDLARKFQRKQSKLHI